ncbi:MAG TPA: hypothetical protein VEC01_05240 [Noviherbaspirillum sp.]|uniref:hypothetical protein n=1 Tax=Noviherbaspirillum sp. TaxID=1926288 RepID=UPI002D50AE44|nr:hypothetical protein [Noviherbaspirillum sp.]HYD94710.1 hypothetical protein [Noviherbaspirillum sp.]
MQLAAPRNLVTALASPKLTVAFFVLMAAGALWTAQADGNATVATLLPLSLLVLNLAAAIATTPRFRTDLPLLAFHLALLAFVALIGAGRLIYFDGATILTSGTGFEGKLVVDRRGPLHRDGPLPLRFANGGFTEHFPDRGRYHATYNLVRWRDDAGRDRVAEIGDDRPLVLDGYRIYTTPRRGFSPLFLWEAEGASSYGTVQLPDNRGFEIGPPVEWRLPDGREASVTLQLGAQDGEPVRGKRDDLGADDIAHRLVLRVGGSRTELRPGQTVELEGGKLTYVRLASWMGYRIVYDPTEPWLAATVAAAIATLLWFYARLFRQGRKRALIEGGE